MLSNIPIVSLDKIYFKGGGINRFLDCTRLDGSKKLVSRINPMDENSVEKQVKNISDEFKERGKNEIILADDVVFSGNVLRSLAELFNNNGIKVLGIRASIATEKSYEYFNNELELGLKCGCILGENVIDQICERDFYFGIAQSGISTIDDEGKVSKSPYFLPFGNPVERASIPKEKEKSFSNGCLLRSMYLWKCIEDNSNRKIYIKDMPEYIGGTDENERVIDVLRKGITFNKNIIKREEKRKNEKNTNRCDGECRWLEL